MNTWRFQDIKDYYGSQNSDEDNFYFYPKSAPNYEEFTDLDLSEYNTYYPHCDFANLYEAGLRGFFKKIPIWVSTMIPKNTAHILAEKEYVGTLIRKPGLDRNEDVSDDNSIGKLITRHNGYAIINDYGLAKIIVS
jgi:hypothetical protein